METLVLWFALGSPAVIFLLAARALVVRLRLESHSIRVQATVTSHKQWTVPGCTCARRRPRPDRARTGCAARTRPRWRCVTSAERPSRRPSITPESFGGFHRDEAVGHRDGDGDGGRGDQDRHEGLVAADDGARAEPPVLSTVLHRDTPEGVPRVAGGSVA